MKRPAKHLGAKILILALSIILSYMIAYADSLESILLHEAASKGDIQKIKYLISKGVDVNVKNDLGMTPLINAAMAGRLESAKLLIDKGADVNAKSMIGTALMGAAEKGNNEVAKLLIARGAYVNAKDNRNGGTALMRAADMGNTEIVKLLIAKGADVNARTYGGWTALSYAMEATKRELVTTKGTVKADRSEIIRLLKQAGAIDTINKDASNISRPPKITNKEKPRNQNKETKTRIEDIEAPASSLGSWE